MTGQLWYVPQTVSQSIYLTLRHVAPPTFRMRSDLVDVFEAEFIYPLEVMKSFVPFVFLKPSDTVLHVGFQATYFDKGMSHPLIEAALVGETGTVRCLDPDTANIEALNQYAGRHGIPQISASQAAAWHRTEDLEFSFFRWGPGSGALKVPGQQDLAARRGGTRTETVHASPLDQLVPDILPDRRLDFLALTVNGAEPEVLQGARETLASNPDLTIGMAIAFRHFSSKIRRTLCDEMMQDGWNVFVSNTPHDPWAQNVFLWCCMVRHPGDLIERLHAKQVTWEQADDLALKEGHSIKNRAKQITAHVLTASES